MVLREIVYLLSSPTLWNNFKPRMLKPKTGLLGGEKSTAPLPGHHAAGRSKPRAHSRAARVLGAIRRGGQLANAAGIERARTTPRPSPTRAAFKKRFRSARGGRQRLHALVFAKSPNILDLATIEKTRPGGRVFRFDVDTLHPIKPLPEYGTNNVSLAVSWDGQRLAHAGTNGVVHLRERDAPRKRTAFARTQAIAPEPGTMRLLGARTSAGRAAQHPGRGAVHLEHLDRPTARALAFNQCAPTRGLYHRRCVTGWPASATDEDGRVFLDAVTGDQLRFFDAHRVEGHGSGLLRLMSTVASAASTDVEAVGYPPAPRGRVIRPQ